MQQLSEKPTKQKSENDLRLLPLGIAALICFIVAVSSGSVFWYLFGSKSPLRNSAAVVAAPPASLKQTSTPEAPANSETGNVSQTYSSTENTQSAPSPSESLSATVADPTESEAAKILLAPAAELAVEGGEVVLGGGETKLPLRRENVGSFAIAETEVTNEQFREFVEATKAKIKLPVGKGDEPMTGISWNEAKAYCEWLSQKIGAQVRLPTEAEWELAARGKEGWKYPWGNEWKDDNGGCKENKGKVKPVKSYPNGKSPFGAYDMVGNVWEWTADAGRDELGKIAKYKGSDSAFANETLYVVKGGAAIEAKANNNAQARINIPMNFRSPDIGFRYIVIREKSVRDNNSQ